MRRPLIVIMVGLLGAGAATAAVAQDAPADTDEFRLTYVATRLSFGGAREVVTTGQNVEVNLDADVLFEFDSSDLSPDADTLLDRTADELAEVGEGVISIIGHTDDQGTRDYNQQLSEERAESVASALSERLGSTDLELETEGRAFDEPAVDGHGEAARAANRRVQITYER